MTSPSASSIINRWESHLATLVVQLHHLLCGVSGDSERVRNQSAACFDGLTYV